MTEGTKSPWYVIQRAELIAKQFILDLCPVQITAMEMSGFHFDFLALFSKKDGVIFTIAIEVKATQNEICGRFHISSHQIDKLLKTNLPVLIIVVDVKRKEVFFNWIKDSIPEKYKNSFKKFSQININLRKATEEEINNLRKEIFKK